MEETIVTPVKTIEELQHEVVVLSVARDNLQKLLSEAKSKHAKDIETIGNALMKEAYERSFCADYDDFITDLNQNLTINLPMRTKTWQVELDITRTISTRVTVEVECAYEEDAGELAENDESLWQDELPSRLEYWDEDEQTVEVYTVREV